MQANASSFHSVHAAEATLNCDPEEKHESNVPAVHVLFDGTDILSAAFLWLGATLQGFMSVQMRQHPVVTQKKSKTAMRLQWMCSLTAQICMSWSQSAYIPTTHMGQVS